MKKFIQVIYKKRIIAFIIKSGFKTTGLKFFTPSRFPQQIAYMNRRKGQMIDPHIHPSAVRRIMAAQETLFIKNGRVRVDFYDRKRRYIESRLLGPGDTVFIAEGGHGFEFMEDSEMIEVKQGPFLKRAQAVKFNAVPDGKRRLKK